MPAQTVKLVVLDPGHGGKDPGAIGISGVFEKHVAFAAAGELARRLRASGRYRVSLTRENDVFIPLEDRVAIAQGQGAALFISLHADAVADHTVRGRQRLYAGRRGQRRAERQAGGPRERGGPVWRPGCGRRAAPRGGDPGEPGGPRDAGGLGRAAATRGGPRWGGACRCWNNPARHAGFAVLKAADIPSVLVEMGFMSNPHDEAALCQASHRAMVAAAIHRAVDGYFASAGTAAAYRLSAGGRAADGAAAVLWDLHRWTDHASA